MMDAVRARLEELGYQRTNELSGRERGLAPGLAEVSGQQATIQGPLMPRGCAVRRPRQLGAESRLPASWTAHNQGTARLRLRPLFQAVRQFREGPFSAEETLLLDHRRRHLDVPICLLSWVCALRPR